jgi:HSP20 family protein
MTLRIRRRKNDGSNDARRPVRQLPSDPFASFEDIHQRMDQFMRSFGSTVDRTGWSPFPVDIEETEDAYIVEIDLPGVSPGDVTLEWNDRELTVHGEVKERQREGFLRQQTRRLGQFHQTVTLPGEIEGERVTASLDDGVLLIRAPKSRTTKARRVQIDSRRPTS